MNARMLLTAVLDAIPQGARVAALFAEDGVVELPFLQSLGIPWQYRGRAEIAEFYDLVAKLYPDFGFKPEHRTIHMETPGQIYAEYTTETVAAETGRRIRHHFTGYLVAERGQVRLLREMLNVVGAAQALLPHGLADLPAAPERITTVAADYRPRSDP